VSEDRVVGTIPAIVTPFTRGGREVDLELLDRHVAWLHDHGIRCIAPLGTNGEGPSLSLDERRRVIERLAQHTSGIALVPGTGCSALPETIELSSFAVGCGAAAVLVAPPWYFSPERDGVERYFGALVAALPAGARVLLYHVPAYTGVPIEVETVARLRADFGDRVAGVKDSSGDVERVIALRRAVPDATVLFGSDASIAEALRAGAHGVVSALANCIPREVDAVRQAIAAGRPGEEEQRTVAAVRELTRAGPRRSALKALVSVATGLPRSAVRPPLADLTTGEVADLGRSFEDVLARAVPL
jgi:4-hydroxy-tetrahydrodipicolinate synthase